MHLCDSCRNYAQCPVTPRPTGVVYSCIHGKPYAAHPHPGAHAMTPTTERVNEILATRSTDSRRGDMEALSAYIASLHAELATARIMRVQDLRLPVETRLTVAVTPRTSTAYGLELRPRHEN